MYNQMTPIGAKKNDRVNKMVAAVRGILVERCASIMREKIFAVNSDEYIGVKQEL